MRVPIHETAARGFTVAAEAYQRARPDYPTDAVASLVAALGLGPGRRLLELGAGTGKLTRLLVPTGASISALEPVAAMRERLVATAPTAELIDGTAEAIPLAAGSVDAVVAAQAFHWFDAVRALSEIHRVLRPGGRVALAWNIRDESVPWVARLGERIRALEPSAPQVRDEAWRAALARIALFGPWTTHAFRHVQRLDRSGVLDRVGSISYVAAADPDTRAAVLADVEAILGEDPLTAGQDVIELPYATEVLWAERISPTPGDLGIVATVNTSPGGVPKLPVDGTAVHRLGLTGDGHDEPEPVHGGEAAAVSLYAQEAIERVRADGHQGFPGAYGENLTLLGLDWGRLAAGDRLAIGDGGLLIELTQHASPCQTIAHWFAGRQIARISPKRHPQDARWYARVIVEGPVAPGMAVRRSAIAGA